MATPTNDSYSVVSGVTMYVGRNAPTSAGADVSAMSIRPSPGLLKSVHTNNLTDVQLCPTGDCWFSYNSASGVDGPWINWCGAAFADGYSTLGAMLYQGGGHLNYEGSEVYGFDLDICKWFVKGSNPSTNVKTLLSSDWCDYPHNGGHWTPATHTYGNTLYVPPAYENNSKGTWVIPNIGFSEDGIQGHQMPHAIGLVEGIEKRFTTNAINLSNSDGYGCSFVDTSRGIAWITSGTNSNTHGRIDLNVAPGSRTITQVNSFYSGGWYNTTRYIQSKDIAVSLYCDYASTIVRIKILDLATGTPVNIDTAGVQSTVKNMAREGFGFDYCPDTGKFYLYDGYGSSTLHVLTPPMDWKSAEEWTWSTEIMGGEATVDLQGEKYTAGISGAQPFNKWKYNPALKCFMWSQGTISRPSPDGVTRNGAFQLYRPIGT